MSCNKYLWSLLAIIVVVVVGLKQNVTAFGITAQILGGTPATALEFPYMAGIIAVFESGKTYNSTGVLIHPNWVITSAYSVEG